MLTKTNLTTCLLLFCCHLVHAQLIKSKKSNPGYIINMAGDTLRGQIKITDPFTRAEFVYFKKENSTTEETYKAGEIKAYEITGKGYYESVKFRFKDEFEDRVFFLKHLIVGDIKLMRLDFSFGENVALFLKNEEVFYLVENEDYDPVVLHRSIYKGILQKVLGDCPIQELSRKSYSFTDQGLVNLITESNEKCYNKDIKVLNYRFRKKRKRPNWQIFAGYAHSKVDPGFSGTDNATLQWGSGFVAGVGIDVPIGKVFLLGELGFMKRTATTSEKHVVEAGYDNTGEVLDLQSVMKFNHAFLNAGLKIPFLKTSNQPYLTLTAQLTKGFKNKFSVEFTEFPPPNGGPILLVKQSREPFSFLINEFEIGLGAGIGIKKPIGTNHLLLELRGRVTKNNQPKDSNIYFSSKSLELLFGLQF